MAKKSNKTAHVLNLLAGHDAAKETEEASAAAEGALSDEAAEQTSAPAPAEPEVPLNEVRKPAAPQPSQMPAKAPTASQNNISLIDKTENDPVADLIQEKLSSEFEKQIQESHEVLTPEEEGILEPSAVMSIEEEPLDSGEGLTSAEEPLDSDEGLSSAEEPLDSGEGLTSAEQEPVVSNMDSRELEKPAAPAPVQTDSEDTSDLQEALNLNTIESANALSEAEEEIEAMAEMDVDLKSEPEPASSAATEPRPEPAQSASTEPEPSPAPSASPEPEPEPKFAAVNVMERIVNDKIIYYMRQFDVCTCDRCKADVIALTLNGLLPKYIVTMPAAVDPLISFYTNRLISDVTVEATKACMVVKENPRH